MKPASVLTEREKKDLSLNNASKGILSMGAGRIRSNRRYHYLKIPKATRKRIKRAAYNLVKFEIESADVGILLSQSDAKVRSWQSIYLDERRES